MRSWGLALVSAVLAFSGCVGPGRPPQPTPTGISPPRPTSTQVLVLTPTASPTVVVPPSPTAPPLSVTPGTSQDGPNIVVSSPAHGAQVKSPVQVGGLARVFEGTVEIVIRDGQGKELGRGVTAASAGAPQRGQFTAALSFSAPVSKVPGTVEVFSRNPRDGSVENLVSVPVVLMPN